MLIDMEFNNGIYTWNNKRADAHQIASWLGRFLISDNAIHLGEDLLVSILPLSGSNHWLIRPHWQRPGDNVHNPFHFEAFWVNHPDFHNLITETWRNFTPPEGEKMCNLQQKLKHIKEQIKHWNLFTFDNIFQVQNTLEQEMKKLPQRIIAEGRSKTIAEHECQLQKQILERARQVEILWRKKLRIRWLKEGEHNTNFFHHTTMEWRMHNIITLLQN